MATPAQVTANRANAQKPTGPPTPDSPELASFPPGDNPLPDSPAALTSPRNWPPMDEKTGKPLYFVG